MADILYDIVPCNGTIPYDKLKYLYNLTILAMDLSEKEIFNVRFNDKLPAPRFSHESRYNTALKRVGFISRDFSANRPSGQLAGEFFALLKDYLAKYNIELFFYSPRYKILREFRKYATLREVNNGSRMAEMIFEDKIDILIDMQGHMTNNFNEVLNIRPAPIIIHWLGYPGTLGLKCIDYHIADKTVIPPESQPYYREKIAYLEQCYQVNNSSLLIANSAQTRASNGYPDDKFIFCHFNDDYKLNKVTWNIWMEILKQAPNSILLCNMKSEKLKETLYRDAEAAGIDRSRILHAKWIYSRFPHLHRLALVDCGLDTYYCNGHTTSSDLIAAGVPVVTYPGNTYQSRVTKSILLSIDMPELIADSWDDYVQKAVKLVVDRDYHREIKAKILRNREKILYNSKLYTESYINLLLNIWKNHFGTELPEGVKEMDVTKFGHNKREQNYKWVFYPGKDSPGGNIEVVEHRYQLLRDYADDKDDCVAFNTDGHIKKIVVCENDFVPFVDEFNVEKKGLWVKQII